MTTRMALRDLWVEHIFWVRNYAVANQAGNAKEAEVAAKEVVTDATRIANSIAPLYGQPAADQLLKLLAGHWGAIKHYSDATVAKDKKRPASRGQRAEQQCQGHRRVSGQGQPEPARADPADAAQRPRWAPRGPDRPVGGR